ncbi:MAG: TonB-dependent receptor [Pyrinomonadaceae bacterium]|nr:TonB-dependent receptor [Pyrinomonadaceae bacterium]
MSKIKKLNYLLAIVVLLSISLFAQSNTGSITGVIEDSNGAVVANASVTVTNIGTNETRTAQTDSDGRYEIPSLPTGIYKVTAKANGFQESTVNEIKLAVGEKARVDVKLGVGQVTGVVTVTADQTRVDTETSTVGDTINSARIENAPVNGRDFTGLLATVPGSVQSTNQFQTSINGIPSTFGGASVLVDGIDAGRVDLNGTSNVLGRIESRVNRVSMDSIQEIQVVESNYSAQYGQALSAVINPITKSGTNEFHGSVFDYIRHEGLDANDFFNNRYGYPRSKFRLNQFGGNVSGKIIEDKLFFFTNYEGVRQTRGQLFTAITPTQTFRNAAPAAVKPLLATLPLPQTAINANTGVYTTQKDGTLTENTGSVKIDFNHTDKSQFSARYNINDSKTVTPYGVGTDQTADGTLRVQLFKLSHNYIFSGSTVNEFAFGINRNVTNPSAGPSTLPIVNFLFGDQAIANIGPAQFNQYRTGTVYQFLDSMSFRFGNHSLKAGTDIRLNRREAESKTQETISYIGLSDPSGLDLLGNFAFTISKNGNPLLSYANENFSFFIQDDWKAHPRLSLNLGLRYDVSTVSTEKNGNLQNFDLKTLTFTPKGQKIHDADTNNFGPRVGFAFDVFGNQKTVLRGGYGIFYNRELPASFGSPQANTYPTLSADFFNWLNYLFGVPGTTCKGDVGGTFGYPIDPRVYNCAVPNAYAIEKKLQTAMAQQWSLNVQHNFGFGVLDVGYVGNHVTHLLTDGVVSPRNLNRKDPVTSARKFANFGDIYLIGAYPSSIYHAMQVNLKRNFTQGFRYNMNYTWAHTIDDVVGFFKDYQDEFNARNERASSDQDIRHNFVLDIGYDLSFSRWFSNAPKRLVDGWQFNSITQIRTGFPVNVNRTGGTFGGFSFRPSLKTGVSTRCLNYNLPNCQFNAAAFFDPGTGVFGNLGRNALRGPGFSQVDFSIAKNTKLTEKTSLNLRMDIFNLFNNVNFADPSGGLVNGDTNSIKPAAFFGQSISTVGNQLGGLLGSGGPRQIQISARFIF